MSNTSCAGAFAAGDSLIATLRHAGLCCNRLSEAGLLDEETTTGAVLGALAGSYPLIAEERDSQPIRWHRFTKKPAQHGDSEAANGADFALAILGENGETRLALFQAKKSAIRETSTGWKVNLRHVVKSATGDEEAQMITLERLGLALTMLAKNPAKLSEPDGAPPEPRLSWVHYLLYGPGTPVCIPLSDMDGCLEAERLLIGSVNYFEFKPESQPSFIEVLAEVSALAPMSWLTIATPVLFGGLPAYLQVLPVLVGGTEKAWKHVPINRAPSRRKRANWKTRPSAIFPKA